MQFWKENGERVCVCVMMTHTKITPEPSPVCLNAMLSEL